MAIDVYLQIDGIKGESADDKHKDWIECKSVNWGVTQPKSATASAHTDPMRAGASGRWSGLRARRREVMTIGFSGRTWLASTTRKPHNIPMPQPMTTAHQPCDRAGAAD